MKQFKLPDNYFEDFTSQMDAKISELSEQKSETNTHVSTKKITLKTFLTAAAVTAILAVSVIFIQNSQQSKDISVAENSMAVSNEEYIDLMFDEIDSDVIEELISEADYNY